MESLQATLERPQDFKRNASYCTAIDLFVCLPQPANLRVSHTSTTDHIPTIRPDSFQSGNSDSGLDCLEATGRKTAFGATAYDICDCDLRFRCTRPTGGFRQVAQSIFSPARNRRLFWRSLSTLRKHA